MQITRILPALRDEAMPESNVPAVAVASITFADQDTALVPLAKADLLKLIAQATDALARFEGVSIR